MNEITKHDHLSGMCPICEHSMWDGTVPGLNGLGLRRCTLEGARPTFVRPDPHRQPDLVQVQACGDYLRATGAD